jgi:hypothetical protein
MDSTKRRLASGESEQQVAKSLRTNECTWENNFEATSTCKIPISFIRFWEHMKWESECDIWFQASFIPQF